MSPLKKLIIDRYSARTFLDREIEPYTINHILSCAYNAPSKQGLYPYTIYVLGEDPVAKEFKDFMFWEDTWCVKGERANPKDKNSTNKRFNGQYKAPLTLLWAHRDLDEDKHKDKDYWEYYWPYARENNLVDMTVSASFAMLAAEEAGLRTCFGRCHSYQYTDTVLGKGNVIVGLALGIGYAEDDNDHKGMMIKPVLDAEGIKHGYETKNLNKSFPKFKHDYRKNKPAWDDLIKFIS